MKNINLIKWMFLLILFSICFSINGFSIEDRNDYVSSIRSSWESDAAKAESITAFIDDMNNTLGEKYDTYQADLNELELAAIECFNDNDIFELLKNGEYTSKEIINKLKLDWTPRKMTSFLKSKENVKKINKKPLKFTLVQQDEYTLFNQSGG